MPQSLQDRINESGSPVELLRGVPALNYPFWYPPEWSTWYDEQKAWIEGAVLFDQTHHMTAVTFRGPDVKRLLSDTGVNSPANLGNNRAKQFVACAPDGHVIGDAILFGLADDEFSLVGVPSAANWVEFQVRRGNYDVEVTRDEATLFNRSGQRRFWRFQLNGPRTQDIIEAAADAKFDHIGFFRMGELSIGGTPVYALNHTMSGVPGEEYTGLELWGPYEHLHTVLDVLIDAGTELGLQRGGATSYVTTLAESGWIPMFVPGIYTQDDMLAYREYLPTHSLESVLSLQGSLESHDIEDFYMYPWDLGYGNLVKFDHDFIGRQALEARADESRRRKVWLRWNTDDVSRISRDSMFGTGERPKIMCLPNCTPVTAYYDAVRIDDRIVGASMWGGLSTNIGEVVSLASLYEDDARDGDEVEITWGEPDGGAGRQYMQPHVQTTLRATVSTQPPRTH
ncbi:hypothetical protein [Gordonia terrae]|uniref:hypothetical protein n=1 Tax=Gordonia terrae TaxID=2055 RepID=UPI003F6CD1DA